MGYDSHCSSYAGIGSRATPPDVLAVMRALAERLGAAGWVLRTGGAPQADQAFMAGARAAEGSVELYLPWPGFQGLVEAELTEPSSAARALASRFHPAWSCCGRGAQALHARNCHQVLGVGLDAPVVCVVCWTPDGSLDGAARSAGGTGQALRIAASRGIPVFNLVRGEHRRRVESFLAVA